MSVKKPIRIGFDLDGVLLYNPARIVRPIISLLKRNKVIHRKELQFFVPKTKWEQLFWRLFHKSSLFISPAIHDIERMVKSGEIEAYVITGRFAHLEKDTTSWFKKFDKKNIFKELFSNKNDEQPHLFKERKIKELKLDYFIEDNWDIVKFLSTRKLKTEIVWITNPIDQRIPFKYKYLSLNKFIKSSNIFKKKILFLTDYYLPHWTGLSKSFHWIISSLEDKANCHVLTINHNRKLKKEESLGKHLVSRSNFLFSFSRAKFSLMLIVDFLRNVKGKDSVVFNSPFTMIFPLTLLAKILGKKVYVFHQGDLNLPGGLLNKLVEVVFNISSFISFSLADGLATYTDDYLKNSRFLKYFSKKSSSFIIPFPFDKKINSKLKKTENIRKKHKTIIGLSGRFVEEKGFDVLFKAIPLVVEKNKDIHFVFAGEKNMGYEDFFKKHFDLYRKVKKDITFLGLLHGKDLDGFYQGIDALVMPSRSDCFGLVQAESMMYQKPVIVTNIIGGRDVVRMTGFGEIAELEDHRDLADKILKFSKNKLRYKKHWPKVEEYFNFEKNSKDLQNWLSI